MTVRRVRGDDRAALNGIAPYRELQNTISLDLVDGPFAESNDPPIWVAEVTLGNASTVWPPIAASGGAAPTLTGPRAHVWLRTIRRGLIVLLSGFA